MTKRLTKKDIAVLDNLDRMLRGEALIEPVSYVEEKLLQVLQSLAGDKEKEQRKQENISRLISDLSHQLKTPLSALSLHLELAADTVIEQQVREESLVQCAKQVEKIHFLSEAMLKVMRLESGLITVKRVSADLAATVKAAVAAIEPAARETGLTMQAVLPDSLDLLHDPLWTKEAILNLLDNAVKYTPQGGVTVTLEKGAIYTCIHIADTGIPLDPAEYAKVFGRFYRVRRPGQYMVEGTGLGLSIARDIMRQQRGNITVSSSVAGNTFTLFLQTHP